MPPKRTQPDRAPGAARITVHDVARAAGVAIGTVSRVVNGAPSVAPDVRQRVEAAIAELGWAPSAAAQAMRGAPTRMVGFIFSDIRNPLYSSMIKGAEDVLSEHGYMLVVASSDGQPAREIALMQLFKRRRADGMLFAVEEESNADVLRCVADTGYPIVLLEREMAAALGAVGADHLSGTRHATAHLLSLGHRRIALISGGRNNRVGRDRLAGLVQAHEAAGVPLDPALLRLDSFASEYGQREVQLLLELDAPPTAIVAAGMHLLQGVLQGIRMKGRRIPQDISLVASNDSPLAQLVTPPVDVIRYDAYALGREAALLLLRRMNGESIPPATRVEVPTEFVLRASSAPPDAPPRG
ncbi:LacI family DNA-binding transcriptional regulator [Achromobacter aloeverae]|uniref:LacI family transcriptional regulator n=1 Tax=Achromobacter aloeverae TaxID=1750518 RepID=A0A4Q1HPB8_9BURK|nr:substrate-binding domain-containing protein [Achromobacter aloeverae]RXN91715.1 LacI family transcriptional regulator [Achromobacter aloeverae]